jgi:hypothetical protein
MEFKIQPKTMTATKLEVKVIGHSDTEVQFFWSLKTEAGTEIDRGNWSLPKSAFLLLGSIELSDGIITDSNLRAAVNQILSDPDIDIVLSDFASTTTTTTV